MKRMNMWAASFALVLLLLGLCAVDVHANATKSGACTDCHDTVSPAGVGDQVLVAVNGFELTRTAASGVAWNYDAAVSIPQGTQFEIDVVIEGVNRSGTKPTSLPTVVIPAAWTSAGGTNPIKGTALANNIASFHATWNGTHAQQPVWKNFGVGGNKAGDPPIFTNEPMWIQDHEDLNGDNTETDPSAWDWANGTPWNDGVNAADLDGQNDRFGTDMLLTTPTTTGTYYLYLLGVGSNSGGGQGYAATRLTVTVTAAGPTTPTLTTPTAVTIGSTTAALGATVTADGGAALTARGTVWGTTAAPTGNLLAEGGTATGVYSHARTALNAGTRIYYRGYATNAQGTSYSPDGSFYTEPATQASGVNFTGVGSGSMTINWTRGSGSGVLVLVKQASAVDADPADGSYTGYTANPAFGSGSQLGTGNYVVYKGTGTNVTVSGLSPSTAYHVGVYEYAGTVDTAGVDQGTNYIQAEAVGNQTTGAGASPPTLTTPTAVTIGSTTATLGATVTADGGAALTARGTVWGTTAAPTGNILAEGGTAVSAFSHARTALNAGTRIFYRGYATNSAGTAYSPDGSFYTEPATQASTVNFTGVGGNGLTVNWTRGSGTEVIVLMKQGAAVDANPADGTYTGYTANAAFGSGTQIGTGNYVLYKGTGTSVAVTGLTASTTYHVAVYEYAGTVDTAGVDQGTNYKLTPATGSQATSAAANNPPTVTGSLGQFESDGTTPIAGGGNAASNLAVIKAQITDPDGDLVILEVDIDSDGNVDCVSAAATGPVLAAATCTALPDGAYDWQVRAKDILGATSAWSPFAGSPDFNIVAGVDIGIDTTPPTESGLAATPGDTIIDLTWNVANDGNGSGLDPINTYKVVRSAVSAPADCSGAAVYQGNINAYTDTGLSNGTTYYYRVCAYDKVGNVSTGQTTSAAPGSSCSYNPPTVTIVPPTTKDITFDGGFADYTVQVLNNDAGACPATAFDLVASDSNGAAFFGTTIATDPLTVVAGGTAQTTIRVTARANQTNGATNSTTVYAAADGNHAQSANSNTVVTTINVSGGGCVAGGNYLNANGDQLITSR